MITFVILIWILAQLHAPAWTWLLAGIGMAVRTAVFLARIIQTCSDDTE